MLQQKYSLYLHAMDKNNYFVSSNDTILSLLLFKIKRKKSYG